MVKSKKYIKILSALVLLSLAFILALSSCSNVNMLPPTDDGDPEDTVSIVKTELINGDLIVTYSDGRVENLGPLSGESDSDSLSFYPLPDGTYGITAGNTIYLEGISIPATYKGRPVTRILNNAFKGLENLKTITIPDSIVSIGASAFSGCEKLEAVTIPQKVTAIDSSAFYGCKGLKEIVIPDSVTEIGSQTFYMCESLSQITLPASDLTIGGTAFFETSYYNNEENWQNGVLYIGAHLIVAKNALAGNYKITDGTLTVADYAFKLCEGVTGISVPDSTVRIGDYAFADCEKLVGVAMGDGSLIKNIGEGAFSNCISFFEFDVPSGLAQISENTFNGCTSIKKLVTKDATSLKVIKEKAFYGCETLSEIQIPNCLERIEASAFEGCEALVTVTVDGENSTLSYIGDRAFYSCKKLANIEIPASVTELGRESFAECAALEKIGYGGTEDQWKKNVTRGASWNKNVPAEKITFSEPTPTSDV